MSLDAYIGMTREQFLGAPQVVEWCKLTLDPFVVDAPPEPFMGVFTARITRDRASLHHVNTFVAGFIRGTEVKCSTLYVHPDYRSRGIGSQLVYTTVTRYGTTTHSRRRNGAGQAVYERVWDMIQERLTVS